MRNPLPEIGAWYRLASGETFEVVAWDPEEQTIEVQYYDGAIEEYDFESWGELDLQPAEPPEDWSGSLDVTGEDYGVDLDRPAGDHDLYYNPLDDIDFKE
jgi:hypothetical protein